jgi:hypothetical protein
VLARKLDEFLALKQGKMSVLQYVGQFNHLSQYAQEHVDNDQKKKKWFLRGVDTKLYTMMNVREADTYHEVVNMAISTEEKYRVHKEAKHKEKVGKGQFSGSSGGKSKRQKIIYHPTHHNRPFQ